MNDLDISQLDEIYRRYGYEVKSNHTGVRAYIYTKSIYNGADLVQLSIECNIEKLRTEFSNEGYAVKIRNFRNLEDAKISLFRDFFQVDGVTLSLKRRYSDFVSRLMLNLPKGAAYQYIESPFEILSYKNSNDSKNYFETKTEYGEDGIVRKITSLIEDHVGPLFIIIEAAAGYGKTCTAYEVLNQFIRISNDRIPFFTELSRDRRATIFSHILRKEIEEQFANRVDSKVVIHEIKNGRIPLIIDGFDELISKDFSFSTNDFEQVESMLSTIVDLLSGNAKIIITSRKTAIFDSEQFFNWMADRDIEYSMARITISEPHISNWLEQERLDIIDSANLPVDQFANPVLLTFLKYAEIENLKQLIFKDKSIVDSYFDFLLHREQDRQSLLMEPETQLQIFRRLVGLFSEFDIKSASKEDVKDFLIEFNRKILDETQKKYIPDNRPRIDQLADTLSNHAFLDRKDNRKIGFVNEFVFGTLIGQNIILNDYLSSTDCLLTQQFALLAVQAFKVQPTLKKDSLWEKFDTHNLDYDQEFFFLIDTELKRKILHNYNQVTIDNYEINSIIFTNDYLFTESAFINCLFRDCYFSPEAFINSTFVNCKFYDCQLLDDLDESVQTSLIMYACTSNNEFEYQLIDEDEFIELEDTINYEKVILERFFTQGGLRPRHRQLSHLKGELGDLNIKDIAKSINKLKGKGYILMNGNLCHLTREGINYYNDNFRNG